MKKENDILAELREWGSPLANMSRAMPYEVPAGYFETNQAEIVNCISNNTLETGNKEMPLTVPEGFFAALPQQMLEAAKAESVSNITSKEMPYTVPEGYFDALPGAIIAQVKEQPKPRVIAIATRVWTRQAVAAMLVLALGLGGYEYIAHRHQTPEKQLAKVSEKTVQEYVHQNLNDMDPEQATVATETSIVNATRQLDKNDIEQYLDETGLKTEYNVN